MWCVYTTEYYPATKKSEILSFETIGMDLKDIMLSKMRQMEKDQYHMISYVDYMKSNVDFLMWTIN